MFLRHLLNVDAAEILEKVLVSYIDFGNQPALPQDLSTYVSRTIERQLGETYGLDLNKAEFVRAVYNREINKFKSSIYAAGDPDEYHRAEVAMLIENLKDRSEHIRRSMEHIRGTERRTFLVVLDNVDQRPPEFQEQVFLIAQSVAETWPATVFVALRPSTFYHSRSKGSLAAYQLRVLTVTPTRADQVISRRLAFAKEQVESAELSGAFPSNMSLTSEEMLAYLDMLIRAFRDNDQINTLVDNMSGGNLRMALTFLASFVGTAYVSTRRVLEAAQAGRVYILPEHEFLGSMIFGDSLYYSPERSEICNLFDIMTDDGREHFLLPIILALMQRQGETAGGDGYVDLSDLYAFIQPLGFMPEQLGPHIIRALGKRLLDAPEGQAEAGPLRITTVGSYMYKSMISRFTYFDAMIVDTPVVDVRWRREILDVRNIIERLDRADIFLDYLNEQWSQWGIEDGESPFDWPSVSGALRSDVNRTRERAVRAQRNLRES